MGSKLRVALVVPGLEEFGGLPAMAASLHQIIGASDRYQPGLLSLAVSSRDEASVRLISPGSWLQGPRAITGLWHGQEYRHVGCYFTEFEVLRYRPRKLLTEILNEYDIIHIISGSPAWAWVAKECRRPVILHVASLASVERKALLSRKRQAWRRLMTRFTNNLDRAALRHVHSVFAINFWMCEYLRNYLSPSRIAFIPPGIDTNIFYPGQYRNDGYILSVGRFADPRKNVRLLIEAYSSLRRAVRSAPRLVLAGDSGPTPEDWKLATSLGVAEHIDIRVRVSSEELAELYRHASMFVLSSDEEGLGIVNLEAMACGIPVISTRCGGPDIVIKEGETGHLTPVGDAKALAVRMEELLANPSRRKSMGEAGLRVVQERFSQEAAGKVFLDKYDELLGGCV
jgi:D-inositol-3-phosphate glycosyltransferase